MKRLGQLMNKLGGVARGLARKFGILPKFITSHDKS
jgi:phage shock protein PspC (stress-responsive transcriptional regulator)